MENIDDMMTAWKEMDKKLSTIAIENQRLMDEIKKNKLLSNHEKLARRYRLFIIFEAAFLPLIILLFCTFPFSDSPFKLPAMIYFVCFFIMEIGFDSFLLYKLNDIDIYNDSISEISHKAKANWKLHKIMVLIGIPVAIVAVILFCLAFNFDPSMLRGVLVGASIGIVIGLNEFFKFMKNYRSMSWEK